MPEILQQFDKIKAVIRKLAENQNGSEDLSKAGLLSNLTEELEMQYRELQAKNKELEMTRQQLEASKQKYRKLFLNSPLGYFLVDEDHLITDVNNAAADLLSTSVSGLLYRRFQTFVVVDDRPVVNQMFRNSQFNYVIRGQAITMKSDIADYSFPVRILVNRENEIHSEEERYRVVVIDQSLLMQVEVLEEKSRHLRSLATHMEAVREEEREAAGKMVHDELGQSFTALNMNLARLKKFVPEDNSSARKIISEMKEITQQSITSAQQITSALRPQMIDELGLLATVEDELESIKQISGIICRFEQDIDRIELKRQAEMDLYRIIRELLTNTLRHARATALFLHLTTDETHFLISYRDNGRGATEKDLNAPDAFGIMSIKERVAKYHGNIKFFPDKTDTFEVRIKIPKSRILKGAVK